MPGLQSLHQVLALNPRASRGHHLTATGDGPVRRLRLRGGFPRAHLARSAVDSVTWRRQFLQTFLERDVPQLGVAIPAPALLRFRTMLAHVQGGIWNATDPARSLGLGESTVRRYLDLFIGLLMVRQLQSWHENLSKRQVKTPKVYVRDSGLLRALLGLRTETDLPSHPQSGGSWERFAIEQVLTRLQPDEAYFVARHVRASVHEPAGHVRTGLTRLISELPAA